MRNASSLPRLDDVIETIEDLQSNPSSRRTTYRYLHIILNLANIKRTLKQLWIYYNFYWLIGHPGKEEILCEVHYREASRHCLVDVYLAICSLHVRLGEYISKTCQG